MTRVSALVATMNRPLDLAHCLQAMEAQHGTFELEVCVVNDGGVPVQPVLDLFPRVRVKVLELSRNIGQVKARQQALELATGDYIAVCDDDDRWLPTHVDRLLSAAAALVRKPDFVVYTDAEIVALRRHDGQVQMTDRRVFAWGDARSLLQKYNPVVPAAILYPRHLHDRIGLFDAEVSHYWDWDFILRAAADGALVRVPGCDVLYRFAVDGDSQSAAAEHMQPALARLIAKHHLGPLPTSNFYRMTFADVLTDSRVDSPVMWNGDMKVWSNPVLTRSIADMYGWEWV